MIKPGNTRSQMRKGILEYCILSIIDGQDEAYASDIIENMKQAKMVVVEGTLYPLLNRMKKSELLDYKWRESPSGPPRKYYTLTGKGKEFLSDLEASWNDIKNAVEQLTENKTKK